ncbi:phage holin [Boudabousia marimammalium]|uniref:Holin n=1 Tax=Boudabousia marimammalium TaxID=156892 RepID=A0A1Q5PPB8_9ACTO|nr:hypothetical protein [Boudabousia marimammalium]OKL49290.1 hypothetical protein BM477_04725 [Boudabousia marimammalium]
MKFPKRSQSHNHAPSPQPLSWLTPNIRRWAYSVITAVVPLLIVYGVLDQQTAPLWIALAASVLGTATAAAHTPRDGDLSGDV